MNFDECKEILNDKNKIVLDDKKGESKFYLENKSKLSINKIKVDGCLKIEGKQCDYLIVINETKKPFTEIYIELKGCRVKDALKQLENTIKQLKNSIKQHFSIQSKIIRFCYIIYIRCPINSTEIQNHQKKFKKQYQATLKFKRSNSTENLDSLIMKNNT